MHWEIGSEFWDIPVSEERNDLFPNYTQWYLSGRSALQAIIKELQNLHTVAMPSWCCDSMVKPFIDAGFDVRFYPVFWRDKLIQEMGLDCEVLFIMDYFGYTTTSETLSGYKGIVIRDVTHSIFSSKYSDADYYFGSLRKWCGIWTGGYAWANDKHRLTEGKKDEKGYFNVRRKAMQQKLEYLEGRRINKDYLTSFAAAEEALENEGIVQAAVRDVNSAYFLDIQGIVSRRRTNAEVLRTAFSKWLIFPEMLSSDCPMFVPILVPDKKRDSLQSFLIQRNIYCPIHWPVSKYHELEGRTGAIYENELSLVCDQRYVEKDMDCIVDIVNDFMER